MVEAAARALVVIALLLAPAAAQLAIRLVTVPEKVVLPADPGSNLMLEVEVQGFPRAVALGALLGGPTVPMRRSGASSWQLNLATPEVAAMLPRGATHGRLFVHASGANGDSSGIGAVSSAPILWVGKGVRETSLGCRVRTDSGTVHDGSVLSSTWLDGEGVTAIELRAPHGRIDKATAASAEHRLPFLRVAESEVMELRFDDQLRELVAKSEQLCVEAELDGVPASFVFEFAPRRLALDGAGEFSVVQRGAAHMPGSRGWLVVRIGDITMGGTELEIRDANGREILAHRLVFEREAVSFALADERYVLVVDRLVNILIGDDHAELLVRPEAGYVQDRIAMLIRRVAVSRDTFLRDGAELDGLTAARLLSVRASGPTGRQLTIEAFVDEVASKSKRSGEDYEVRSQDGTTMTMREWLQRERKAMDDDEAQRK